MKHTTLWLAVLSVWGYSGSAMACASLASISGTYNSNVASCTNVYAPTTSPTSAVVTIDGATGGGSFAASGDDVYFDTYLSTGQISAITAFINVAPSSAASNDVTLTFSGNQKAFLSASNTGQLDGIAVMAGRAANANVVLDGANFDVNVGSHGANGVTINAAGSKSATFTLTNGSTLDLDTGGSYGIEMSGPQALLTNVGTNNTLDIGAAFAPAQSAIYLSAGAKVQFAGLVDVNSTLTGIDVRDPSVLGLDGVDATRSAINVAGGPSQYAVGLNYETTDTGGALKNVTVNLSAGSSTGGSKAAEGFNVNVTKGGLDLKNVRLTSNMIDSAALTVPGGAVSASGLAVDVNGEGTGGIDVEPNAAGQITLTGTAGSNTIVTRGAPDYNPTYTDLPYSNAAGVRLLGGSISLASTDVETFGNGAPGIYLGNGTITTGASVAVHTHGDGADGIVYTPFSGATGNVTTQFSSTTSVETDGSGAYGFVVDDRDLYATTTFSSFSLPFSSTGLNPADISVQGAGSAAIGARNGATLVLDGQNLGVLAGLPAGTYAVEAGPGGTVQFTAGAAAGGASLLAGAGGTLAFNDSTASASGSLVTISQGSGSAGGELDLSGRTQALRVGQLASAGGGATNGIVNLGSNTLELDGSSATPATFSGAIDGSGGLAKLGTGVQVLSGQHVFDYAGATQLRGGTLAVAGGAIGRDANGFKWFQFSIGGTLDIGNNQSSFEAGAISGFGTVQLTDSGTNASSNLIVEGTGTPQTFAGAIDGNGGVVLRGNAAETFTGSRAFGFTGDVTLGGGTLVIEGNAQAPAKQFVFDDSPNTGGTLDISAIGAAGFSVAGIQATNAATTAQVKLGGSSGTPSNLILAGAGNYSYGGTISGYGNVVKQGTGTQTMSGTNPFAFNGMTVIAGGVLQLRNIADPSQLNQTFELNGGWLDLSDSTFDSSGRNANDWANLHVTDGSLASQGGIIGGDDKVTLGGNAADSVEAAQIDSGVFVVKTGSNTTTLTGTNTYVGNTRILGGTLKVSTDANLGNTSIEREVVLDGGNLEIGGGGNFASSRQLQLQAAGAAQVDGAPGVSATLGTIAGRGQTFTKTGGGALMLTGGGSVGQVIVNAGALDLGSADVDATTLPVAGQAAITQAAGTTVSFEGATVNSQGDAVVANGASTLNLSANTQIMAGGAAYRVTSGTGTLNASGENLSGSVLEADGAGSTLAIVLSNNSRYAGTPSLTGGAAATMTIDGSSVWSMTGSTALASLTNLGAITFGAAGAAAAVAKAEAGNAYQTLTVNGNYQGGGALNMRTELNVGGALTNQFTDRSIVTGNVSGQTSLNLATSGAGANTDTAQVNQAIPTEGISLVQVEGNSSAGAFVLKGGYVAAEGSPYQYRIFAYGPGSYALPAASQSLLPDGTAAQWDYRLQTSYLDDGGQVQPGPGPYTGTTRPSIVPQASSDLTVPLALQNYESVMTDNLYRRLGDVRHGAFDEQHGETDDVFARTIDSRSMYHSNRSFAEYGYDFGQYVTAVQFGADWLHRRGEDNDFRLGTAVTLGYSSVFPQAAAIESSNASIEAYDVALTGTWQRRDGSYVDGVLSSGWYIGEVDTAQHGEVSRLSANGFDGSLEAGRDFRLANSVEIEPHARLLAQFLHFQGRRDNDAVDVTTGDLFAFTGLVGVRTSISIPNTVSFRPYMRIDFAYAQTNSPSVTMSGQPFAIGGIGGAVQIGLGATGMVTSNFSIYGELSGQQRLGPGMSTLAATLGLRYSF